MLEGLELERWENVWEELVRGLKEFCIARGVGLCVLKNCSKL